jgi:hypothetical protein
MSANLRNTYLIFFLFLSLDSVCQRIDNKFDLVISAGIIEPLGSTIQTEGGFITPSLYNNYQNNKLVSIKGLYNYNKIMSFGAEWKQSKSDNWSYDTTSNLYEGAITDVISIAALIKLRTKFNEVGVLNKFQIYSILAPSMNFVHTKLIQNIYDIEPLPSRQEELNELNFTSFGIGMNIGVSYSLTQSLGILLEGTLNYTMVGSTIYVDKNFYGLGANAGIIFKLFKDKRYYL